MKPKKRRLHATFILPPVAFIWAVLQTAASPWAIGFGLVFAVVAIPLGRWVDRENHYHHYEG